jgi:hypothetical protein
MPGHTKTDRTLKSKEHIKIKKKDQGKLSRVEMSRLSSRWL